MMSIKARVLLLLAACAMASPTEAYWGYVPIRPANRCCRYCEPSCYKHPGVINLRDGAFVGRDALGDLPESIRYEVEIVQPPWDRTHLCPDVINEAMEFQLKTVGIETQGPLAKPQDPFRPWLHMLLFLMPVDDGYVCHLSLRLFEKDAHMKRGIGKGGEWQVITWEKQAFFHTCVGDLNHAIRCHANSLTDTFTRLYSLEKRENAAQRKPLKGYVECDACRIRY